MAVQLVGSIHYYIGLSSDVKPISGVRKGSMFHELDTGLTYRLGLGNLWYADRGAALSTGQFQEGISELRVLAEQMLLELQAANKANNIEVE